MWDDTIAVEMMSRAGVTPKLQPAMKRWSRIRTEIGESENFAAPAVPRFIDAPAATKKSGQQPRTLLRGPTEIQTRTTAATGIPRVGRSGTNASQSSESEPMVSVRPQVSSLVTDQEMVKP